MAPVPGAIRTSGVRCSVIGKLSGTFTAQSGLAAHPGLSLPTEGLATRPNATGVPDDGPETKTSWFNTAAFTAPQPGMYGNAGVGVIRGPGFVIWTPRWRSSFQLREKAHFSLRGEFFNTLNHTNWSGVSTNLGSGTYGQVTSARDPRRITGSASLRLLDCYSCYFCWPAHCRPARAYAAAGLYRQFSTSAARNFSDAVLVLEWPDHAG